MKVHQLSLEIDGKELLSDLSFEIPEKSIFLILGPNGAGKTLLLRCLAGLRSTSRGFIRQESSSLAWVPLSQTLPFSFRVDDLLLMGRFAQHQGFPQDSDRAITETAAKRLGISHLLLRHYNSLSRGEQTKVDIARALASESPWILLDEPFSNLDIDASLHMVELFHELRHEGKTLVLSHHDLYSARELATHGLLLKKGKVLAAGAIEEIFRIESIKAAYNVQPIFAEPGFIRFEKFPD